MKPGDLIVLNRSMLDFNSIPSKLFKKSSIGVVLGDHMQDQNGDNIIKVLIDGVVVGIYEDAMEPFDETR